MILSALAANIDALVAADRQLLADPESIVELHRQIERLQAVSTRATGCFERGDDWQADGARTAAGWISFSCRIPKSAAKRQVALARKLDGLPASEQAWLAGDIGAAHLQVLADVRRPATEDQLALDEAMLVGHAKILPFHQFVRVVAYWSQHADPDGDDQGAADQRAARRCHLSQTIDGMWFGDVILDPLSGQIVANELNRLEEAMFKADWTEARDRLGIQPGPLDLDRTPAQRRSDALVEMAIRSAAAPPGGRRPEPLFTVLIGWETLQGRICQLANGTVIPPASLIPWLDQAWLERVVFRGPSRVIDVGAAQRLFTGATRRAVEVRDQECFHKFCNQSADECQVDHIIPSSEGGPTIQSNGRLACSFHNRARPGAQPP